MFARILKLILAGIVAILVPDDNPIPPPWYTQAEEMFTDSQQFFSPSSAEAIANRQSYEELKSNHTLDEIQ